jgi:hypothetical protein
LLKIDRTTIDKKFYELPSNWVVPSRPVTSVTAVPEEIKLGTPMGHVPDVAKRIHLNELLAATDHSQVLSEIFFRMCDCFTVWFVVPQWIGELHNVSFKDNNLRFGGSPTTVDLVRTRLWLRSSELSRRICREQGISFPLLRERVRCQQSE